MEKKCIDDLSEGSNFDARSGEAQQLWIYLDELPEEKGRHKAMYEEDLFSHAMSCGFICDGGQQ